MSVMYRPGSSDRQRLRKLTSTIRSNAIGVGSVIRTARGKVLGIAREDRRWRLNSHKLRQTLLQLRADLQTRQHEVEAEVGEFIQSPHLLFRPLRLALALLVPIMIPLLYMPSRVLMCYTLFVWSWYLGCLLMFATEVAMRPPWYRKGLPSKDMPPYWKGFVHNPKVDLGMDFEDVEFRSASGSTLRGWFIPARLFASQDSAKKMVVFVHGVGRDRRAFLRHASEFARKGWGCLLFDFSEHGLSDGLSGGCTRGTLFGAREQHDVVAAVDYLKKGRGASEVAIVGTSCGASSGILAAAMRPDLAVCVVAENPFTRADELLCHHLDVLSKNYLSQNSHQTVRRVVFWLAGKLLMLRMGYYTRSFGAIDAVGSLKCPLLVAHSTEDDIVPFKQGLDIYNTAAKAKQGQTDMVEFVRFSDAAHCALYDNNPSLWTSTVLPFVEKAFEQEGTKKNV